MIQVNLEISNEKLKSLLASIRPVLDFPDEGKCFVKPVDPRRVSYIWDPTSDGSAKDLKPICDIETYHEFGYYGLFKPSIAEVLAQIPEDKLDQVVAFEIVEQPRTAEDLNRQMNAIHAGFHKATTRLYSR